MPAASNHDDTERTSVTSGASRPSAEGAKVKHGGRSSSGSRDATKRCRRGGTGEDDGRGGDGRGRAPGSDCEVEDTIGRRKHALAVEVPRTVLFRLVREIYLPTFRLSDTDA